MIHLPETWSCIVIHMIYAYTYTHFMTSDCYLKVVISRFDFMDRTSSPLLMNLR